MEINFALWSGTVETVHMGIQSEKWADFVFGTCSIFKK